jgi:hypothetical protein
LRRRWTNDQAADDNSQQSKDEKGFVSSKRFYYRHGNHTISLVIGHDSRCPRATRWVSTVCDWHERSTHRFSLFAESWFSLFVPEQLEKKQGAAILDSLTLSA